MKTIIQKGQTCIAKVGQGIKALHECLKSFLKCGYNKCLCDCDQLNTEEKLV